MHTWMPKLKTQCHLETLGKREAFRHKSNKTGMELVH